MAEYNYRTSGTCSKEISFELDENNVVKNVSFVGGCHGNLQGICKLVEGMNAEELVKRLSGIKCGFKATSCPDQLSRAITEALESKQRNNA